VLTASRVSAHLTAGAGYRAAVLADTPSAYWRLDDGAGGPGPNTIVNRPAYVQNDSVTATATSATGSYLVDYSAFSDVEDPSGARSQCSYSSYDGQAFALGQSSGLTAGEVTAVDRYTSCGTSPSFTPSGQIRTTHAYDVLGTEVASSDPNANAGNGAHLGCAVGSTSYSACTTHDGTFATLPIRSANALGQTSTTGYQSPAGPSTAIGDGSGHGNQATWSGGVGFGAAGLVGGDGDTAASFDGSSGVVQSASLAPLRGDSARSVELWLQTTNPGQQAVLDGGSVGANGQAFEMVLTQSNGVGGSPGQNTPGVYLVLWGDDVYLPGLSLADGHPHHLVVTLTGSSLGVYVDGATPQGYVWQGSGWSGLGGQPFGLPILPNTGGGQVQIGRGPFLPGSVGSTSFQGTLDEVAVYDHVLSAARVSAHRTAGAGYRASVLADSPTAYWRLDDGTGSAGSFGGFGLWPMTSTDANGQTTALSYDALGRESGRTLPGEQGTGVPSVLADVSGRGNQAGWSGGVGFGAAGLIGGDGDTATSLDGASGYVAAPSLTPMQGDNTRSVELWFQTSSSTQQGLLDGGDAGGGQAFAVALTQSGGVNGSPPVNTPGLYINLAGSGDTYVPGLSLADGHAHHLVITLSGTSMNVYVDGQQPSGLVWGGSAWSSQAQPFALPVTPNTAANPLWIGHTRWVVQGTGSAYFNGTVDEVAVYGTALPAARVQAHRTAGAGYRASVLADSPVGYYRLDDAGAGQTTLATGYTVWCSGPGAQSPCVEVDKTQRLNNTTTATSRAFYDGLGHLVETRSPAPGGQDVVRYSFYDASQRLAFQSAPYLVAAYTGGLGAAAYSIPDSTQAGTTTTYDGLGRVLASTDALSFQSRKSYAVACNAAGTSDAGCYEQTLSVDARGHQGGTLVDGLGRTAYEQRYTGSSSSNYAVYATARYTYDFAGDLVRIGHPDGSTQTTFGYDMAGRKTAMTDPDLGAQAYAYDQDGNLVQSVDARGAAGTIFVGYDGLDRPIWRNTTNSPTGAYDTFAYDSTASGNVGIGRLTSETFSAGALTGGYAYVYDGRGQQTASTLTLGAASYPLASSYDDAGNVLTQTYPDGEQITNSYSAQGWLSGVSTTTSGTTTTLASNLAYTGVGGAFGDVTAMHLGGGYDYSASYDLLGRATDLKTKRTSDSATLFDQARTFDGAGNVSTASTTMPAGTDNQAFCYDEQDRLTWAGSTGTPPCTGTATGAGTLTGAQYTQAFGYDTMGRLTTGPLGSYAYGSSGHVHAATGIGTTWTAAYDAAGNMTCRAPSTSSTCAGTPTGAQLGYNNEGELASWQNAPSSPSTTDQFLYDGQGQRVEQSVTQAGTTTTTAYVGGVEEVATTGGTATTTAYYYAGSQRIGLSVNGVVSYLASDGLGSANVTLSTGGSGSATASQLYAPYGGVRYSSGTMPTSYGFTGQRADGASGLDYYGSRYYDPLAGQFTSGDTVVPSDGLDIWGLSRYAYVEGNPIDRIDPTGHRNVIPGNNGGICDLTDPSCGGGQPDPTPPSGGGGAGIGGHPTCWMTGGVCTGSHGRSGSTTAGIGGASSRSGSQAVTAYQANLKKVQATRTSQLLVTYKDDWSSLDPDTVMALTVLSMGGQPDQYCQTSKCRAAMQSALQYVGDLQTTLALGMTVGGLSSDQSWGNLASLTRHFRDHGSDFGSTSAREYARQASEFLQRSQQEGMPTKIDKDGIIRVYDPQTNTFGAYNADGTTRTLFKPTSPTYWDRQPGEPV
jgi:RHS repeat-associated protein